MPTILRDYLKLMFALLSISVVAASCDKYEYKAPRTTTLQFYIDELEPCAMTSCNYAPEIDPENRLLRLKVWLGKKTKSGYQFSSRVVYSDSPIINVDYIDAEGEYLLYGWADYTRPDGEDAHYAPLGMPSVEQLDFTINDDSYAAYMISTRIKNGKFVEGDGRLQRATTKYRIVTEDEELAARVATIELREWGNYATAGIDLYTMDNNLYKEFVAHNNKATYVDEPRCLATAYTMMEFRNMNLSLERKFLITLKDANGEEIVRYKNIVAMIDNDLLTTITLPAPDRYLDFGEYALSPYNEEYAY